MSNRAEWRTIPDDPRTSLGWFLADADRRAWSPSVVLVALALLSLLTLVWSPWMLLVLPLLVLNARLPSRVPDLSALSNSPPPGPAFACRLKVMVDVSRIGHGTLLSADEGIATFVDGWLHVAARRTDFALRRMDLLSATGDGASLRLGLPNGRTLMLVPRDERDTERLGRAFRLWSGATVAPEGESLFPPEGVHPTGLARAWHGALVTVAGFLALLGLFLALRLGAAFVFISGGGGFAAFHRLIRVRRLAKEQLRERGQRWA